MKHNITMIEYDNEVIKILKQSELEAHNLSHQYVSTEHIILACLKDKNSLTNIFNKVDLNYEEYKNIIKSNINKDENNMVISYTPLVKKLLMSSTKNNKVYLKELIIRIIEEPNSLAVTLLNMINKDVNKLYNLIKNDINTKYGINLNKELNNEIIYGRDKELKLLIEVLCRKNKCNAILIGEAGVGKTALVELLAQKINNNEVPNELKNKEIISISMSSLVSGTRYRGEFEEKLETLINSFENNDKYILFIDEIHTILGAGASEGSIDAANILKPYLARNRFKCIGATTINEYNNSIKKDKALNRRFETILINEPNKKETEKILFNVKKYYEEFHNVKISNKNIKEIINLSNKYILDKKEPDRSLEILDKACTRLKLESFNNNDLNSLIIMKTNYIKEKDFIHAKSISKKIDSYKKKSKELTSNIIRSCYEIKNSENIGFKTK